MNEDAKVLPKGSAVFVRCANGDLRENVVWEDFGDVVLVCAKDQFERKHDGYRVPMPIGFRRVDVIPANVA
jgi:hypothetical protein